jgi:hypothetical protein
MSLGWGSVLWMGVVSLELGVVAAVRIGWRWIGVITRRGSCAELGCIVGNGVTCKSLAGWAAVHAFYLIFP